MAVLSSSSTSQAHVPLRQYQSVPQCLSSSQAPRALAAPTVRIASGPSRPLPGPHETLPWVRVGGLPAATVRPAGVYRAPRLTAVLPQGTHRLGLPIPRDGWTVIKRTTSTLAETVGASTAPEDTFNCPFCLENVRVRDRVVLEACGGDVGHGVCRDCMSTYVRGLVTDGRVNSIECHKCRNAATPAEVRSLTDEATFRKYERFKQMHQDHTVRECPFCTKLCKPEIDEEGNPVAEMQCDECGGEFCYYHSNAHPGISCAEYRKRVSRDERINELGPLRETKACPVCGVRTEKTGGCNHMTCQRCGSDWCWVCGKKLARDEITTHYYFGGPFSCGQFTDDLEPRTAISQTFRFIVMPVQFISVLVFVLLSLTLVFWFPLIYIILAPIFLSCRTCKMPGGVSKCVVLLSILMTFLPFMAFQLVWILCAGLIWCVLRPCGSERRHFFMLIRAPALAVLPVLLCAQLLVEHVRGADDAAANDENAGGGPGDADVDLEAAAGEAVAHEGSEADSSSGSGSSSSSSEE